jgi:hypothetical protein
MVAVEAAPDTTKGRQTLLNQVRGLGSDAIKSMHNKDSSLRRNTRRVAASVGGAALAFVAVGLMPGTASGSSKNSITHSAKKGTAKYGTHGVSSQWVELNSLAWVSSESDIVPMSLDSNTPPFGASLPKPAFGNEPIGHVETTKVQYHTYEMSGPCSSNNGNHYSHVYASIKPNTAGISNVGQYLCAARSNNGHAEQSHQTLDGACYPVVILRNEQTWGECKQLNFGKGTRFIGKTAALSYGFAAGSFESATSTSTSDFGDMAVITYAPGNDTLRTLEIENNEMISHTMWPKTHASK